MLLCVVVARVPCKKAEQRSLFWYCPWSYNQGIISQFLKILTDTASDNKYKTASQNNFCFDP